MYIYIYISYIQASTSIANVTIKFERMFMEAGVPATPLPTLSPFGELSVDEIQVKYGANDDVEPTEATAAAEHPLDDGVKRQQVPGSAAAEALKLLLPDGCVIHGHIDTRAPLEVHVVEDPPADEV